MAEAFVAEIRIFAGNFAPTGWALCNGQLQPISQNTALFSLIGTYYGGDGKSTFALPDLQGRAPMMQGQGSGLSQRFIGESSGESNVTLLVTEMPIHQHGVQAGASAGINDPGNNTWGTALKGFGSLYTASGAGNVNMSPIGTSVTGSSFPHNNMPPYLGLTFIIALQGIFPARN